MMKPPGLVVEMQLPMPYSKSSRSQKTDLSAGFVLSKVKLKNFPIVWAVRCFSTTRSLREFVPGETAFKGGTCLRATLFWKRWFTEYDGGFLSRHE